MTKKLNT